MKQRIHLLIIDPQNDFCDLPESWRPCDPLSGTPLAPALPVPGAHADLMRVAHLVRAGGAGLSDVTVTLDAHHRLDVAHPDFWRTGTGEAVAPFTAIAADDVRAGRFEPRDAAVRARTLSDLETLEAAGRYTLMVWPVHCEIGTWGQGVHAGLRAAYNAWEVQHLRGVAKVTKGENPWTEHYSAIQAEVPDAADPRTQSNTDLLARLDTADLLLIAGEASSHCVKATTEHILAQWPGGRPERVVLIGDGMSPVPGFEAQHRAFLQDMGARGVRQMDCAQVLPLLLANAPSAGAGT